MTSQLIATLVSLISISGSVSTPSKCSSRQMCTGLAKYGDEDICYRPGTLMRYPSDCFVYRCERRGQTYTHVPYNVGCKYGETCKQNGDYWRRKENYGCMEYTCIVSGIQRVIKGVPVSCNENY